MKILSWVLLFFSTLAQADISNFSSLIDSQGNYLTTQSSGSLRPLDIGIAVGGASVDPRDRNWNTNSLVDSMACTQSGSWSVTATQGTSPWVSNITQFGSSNVVTGTGNSGSGIPRVTVSNDSSITNITGTISLPTGAATSSNQNLILTSTNSVATNTSSIDSRLQTANGHLAAIRSDVNSIEVDTNQIVTSSNSIAVNQINGTQKTQIVDSSGNVITTATIGGLTSLFPLNFVQLFQSETHYCARVPIRQTATSAALTTVWAMRYDTGATRTAYVDYVELSVGFDATNPITAQSIFYGLHRFDTATPTGGTSINESKMQTGDSASSMTDIRYVDTGLTTTGVGFNTAYATLGVPAVRGSVRNWEEKNLALRLTAGQGLAIRIAEVAALVGQSITGKVCWSEK